MQFDEQALVFDCQGERLVAVASVPTAAHRRGVLIVVGGPQYRAGSHRQFVLLARALAAQGYACLRFDARGMGDSTGAQRTFEDIGDDLGAATDAFIAAVPAVQEVVIWGLCDAATAALFYAAGDARIKGLVLVNPWARTTGGLAKATLKHYYLDRLRQPALWKKIASGKFDVVGAARSFTGLVGTALAARTAKCDNTPSGHAGNATTPDAPLPERMRAGFERFTGPVLLVTCDIDLTAQEFMDATRQSSRWQKLLKARRVLHRTVADADHTFSRRIWRDGVAALTGEWLATW